jgi:hypothetical protein
MAFVEHDWVANGDRSVEIGLVCDQFEQGAGSGADPLISLNERPAG